METADCSLDQICIPSDDAEITDAIAALDETINSWCAAAGELHQALDRRISESCTQSCETACAASSATKDGIIEAASPTASSTHQPVKITRDMLEKGNRSNNGPSRDADGDDGDKAKKKGLAAKFKRLVCAGAEQDSEPSEQISEPTVDTAKAVTGNPQPGSDEDEALLASLAPDVARTIQMRRRLCNGQKSVRQLLDELN